MESTVKCREGVCLHAEQIDKIYPGTKALDHVSFDVLAGKVNVLIGENGAGKSTLMKIIAGIEQPSAGTLYMGTRKWLLRIPRKPGSTVSVSSIRN